MNSTSIFGFLKPKLTTPAKQVAQRSVAKATRYIDRLINAVKLSRQLELSGKSPTTNEVETLKGFFGYGKVSAVFDPNNADHDALKDAFGDEKLFEIARKGVLHSYYTPDTIVSNMWRALCRLGVTDGIVLEPSCGTGQFIQQANPSFDGKFVGVELDPIAGTLARQINPKAKIYTNQRLENAQLPNSGDFDACIGNPPFGSMKAHDQRFGNISIHNYFVLRGLSELRDGGILAYVVSNWVMDAKSTLVREQIAKMADLVAAVRLPNSAFSSEGVSVGTDILIFQKNRTANKNPSWIHTGQDASTCEINQYFIDRPEHVLGKLEAPESLFDYASCKVVFDGDLDTELCRVLDSLTQQPIFHKVNKSLNVAKKAVDVTPTSPVSRYEIFNINGDVYQRIADSVDCNGFDSPQFQALTFKNNGQEKRVLAYIEVKEAMKALLAAEQANETEFTLAKCRETLNLLHDGYVKAFGPLSRTSSKSVLSQCSQYLRVKALEIDYIAPVKAEGIKESFNKAKILSKRVYQPFKPLDKADSYEMAFAASFNEMGVISIERIAELMGVDADTAVSDLCQRGLMYKDPKSGEWVDSVSYLSGNVREKLAIAESAQESQYVPNINALSKVIPADLGAEEITVTLGALWVPNTVYQQFANELMGENADFTIAYIADKWEVKAGGYGYWSKMSREFGTSRRNFDLLLENLMNGTPIRIMTDKEFDVDATAEANAKGEEITLAFSEWIWNCPQRRAELCGIYNKTFNSYVVADYTELGQGLVLNGCTMTPFIHQKRAIMRGLLNANTFYDCCVGSGKTLIFQGLTMMLKRLNGDAERPAIVMPNPLVAQFSNSMSATFPHANIITLDSALTPAKREELLNTVMSTSFDLLIIPESTFTAIEAPRETVIDMLDSELRDLRISLEECNDKNFNTKRIEKRIESQEAKLLEVINKPTLNSVSWSDLNISTLLNDESQTFKNLGYSTTHSNVRGMGSANGSKKAFDFFVKCRYTQSNNGRVVGGTGTSLSNSIVEAVTWLKIFSPELEHTGLHRVDAFIRQFSNPVTQYSLAATGRTMKITTTLQRFSNLAELLALYRQNTEVLSPEQLESALPALPDGRPAIPPLKTGKVQNIILPISVAQDEAFKQIVADASNIDNKNNNMLRIIDTARKASLDIRHLDHNAVNPNNVANAIVENVVRLAKESAHFKGTQIIFSDRSAPLRHKSAELAYWKEIAAKAEAGDLEAEAELNSFGSYAQIERMLNNTFSLYDELETLLTARGLKVAIVHDFNTDAKKLKLKNAINNGEYHVVIGSTAKLGVGWNINNRLIAIHHADLCLRPGDLEQREGRIRRQGSEYYLNGMIKEVEIFTYSTEQTLDAWFADLLDRKSSFIKQFNNCSLDTREYEASEETIDFATLSALCSGDPRLMTLVRSQQELKRLSILERSYQRKTYNLQDDLNYQKNRVARIDNQAAAFAQDEANAKQVEIDQVTSKDGAINFFVNSHSFENVLNQITKHYYHQKTGEKFEVACLGDNFKLVLEKTGYSEHSLYLVGGSKYYVIDFTNGSKRTMHKVFRELETTLYRVTRIQNEMAHTRKEAEKVMDSCRNELNNPFKHSDTIKELKATIRNIEIELAGEKKAEKEEAKKAA